VPGRRPWRLPAPDQAQSRGQSRVSCDGDHWDGAVQFSHKNFPEVAKFGELVVITIPEKNIPDLPRDLFAETPDTVVVVDTGNYYPRQLDGRIDGIEAGLTESR
jgi:predicted dinucleotide-binding enzyme